MASDTSVGGLFSGADGRRLRQIGEALFSALARCAQDGAGVTRDSYGTGESAAIEVLRGFASTHGLVSEVDAAGNLWVSLPGQPERPPVVIGSHIDSVPQGGNYDGAAGIVAGLLCLVRMSWSGVAPPHPVKVLALRGEESAWFGKCYVGSSALFGGLTKADLDRGHRSETTTLRSRMALAGAAVGRIEAGERLIGPVTAYLELHIEQGPVLVERGEPMAIVTGIQGNVRWPHARCIGEDAHSGTTPMAARSDAVMATAELLLSVEGSLSGVGLVTAGILQTDADRHAVSKVPGHATFALECRAMTEATLLDVERTVRAHVDRIERARRVRFELGLVARTPPVAMTPSTVDHLADAAGRRAFRMPSGAGHDAAVFAQNGVPTGMVFVRNANGSHNPHEAMAFDDFAEAASTLFRAVLTMPSTP